MSASRRANSQLPTSGVLGEDARISNNSQCSPKARCVSAGIFDPLLAGSICPSGHARPAEFALPEPPGTTIDRWLRRPILQSPSSNSFPTAVSKTDSGGGVIVEQLGIPNVPANDGDRAVAGLLHDRALALAGLGGGGGEARA